MFKNFSDKLLSRKGKKFLNSNLEYDVLEFIEEIKNYSVLDKLLILFSKNRKQEYIRNILYREFFLLQLEFRNME